MEVRNMSIDILEKKLRVKLKDYKSKNRMIEEVIPEDLDELFEIVKNNQCEFAYDIKNIRRTIASHLERKIGLR
jgi:hypothetical protein|tara:strand:- start:355 stop:576 length:222 start_codon:yes stop_codon:yes gene_type:complete